MIWLDKEKIARNLQCRFRQLLRNLTLIELSIIDSMVDGIETALQSREGQHQETDHSDEPNGMLFF